MSLMNESNSLTKPQFFAWFSAFAGWIFDYYEIFLATFLVIPISREFDLEPSQTAYFFSVQLLFLAVGGLIFGYLADRYGRQRILMWTIVIYSIFTLARAFSPDYTLLLILTAIAATGLGGEYGVGQTLVSEVMPFRSRGWWGSLLYSGTYFGKTAAVFAGGYLLSTIGWRWVFVISSIPIILAAFIRYAAPESDVWAEKQRTALRRNMNIDWSSFLHRSFIVPFLLCLVAGVLQFFAFYGVTSFLPTYLVENQGFSMAQASWWIFLTTIAGFAGCIVGAFTNDRWGRRITVTYLAGSAAIGGLVLALFWSSLLNSPWILAPFFVHYLGTSAVSVFGPLFSEQFPTELRSTGVSAALQVARGVSFLPPLVVAAIYPIYGYAPIVYGGAALFGILALWIWVFKDNRNMDIAEVDSETDEVVASRGDARLREA